MSALLGTKQQCTNPLAGVYRDAHSEPVFPTSRTAIILPPTGIQVNMKTNIELIANTDRCVSRLLCTGDSFISSWAILHAYHPCDREAHGEGDTAAMDASPMWHMRNDGYRCAYAAQGVLRFALVQPWPALPTKSRG